MVSDNSSKVDFLKLYLFLRRPTFHDALFRPGKVFYCSLRVEVYLLTQLWLPPLRLCWLFSSEDIIWNFKPIDIADDSEETFFINSGTLILAIFVVLIIFLGHWIVVLLAKSREQALQQRFALILINEAISVLVELLHENLDRAPDLLFSFFLFRIRDVRKILLVLHKDILIIWNYKQIS